MATTSIWKVEQRLDHVIDYAEDEMKTHKEENELKGIKYKDEHINRKVGKTGKK